MYSDSGDYLKLVEKLRQARSEAGLTLEEAARAFGRSPEFLVNIEAGERRIDPVELCRFAVIYKKPVAWFLPQAT